MNRSWVVAPGSGSRLKGPAPVARAHSGDYVVALAPGDAFWVGFEADAGRSFAVLPSVDGRLVASGGPDPSDLASCDPADLLVVPEQPWFDSVGGRQLVAPHADPATAAAGAVVGQLRLLVREIFTDGAPVDSVERPIPQFTPGNPERPTEPGLHPWSRRAVTPADLSGKPDVVVLRPVDPAAFAELSVTGVRPHLPDDGAGPPPPHSFFQ